MGSNNNFGEDSPFKDLPSGLPMKSNNAFRSARDSSQFKHSVSSAKSLTNQSREHLGPKSLFSNRTLQKNNSPKKDTRPKHVRANNSAHFNIDDQTAEARIITNG